MNDYHYRVGSEADENDSPPLSPGAPAGAGVKLDPGFVWPGGRTDWEALHRKLDRLLDAQERTNSLLLMLTQLDPYDDTVMGVDGGEL